MKRTTAPTAVLTALLVMAGLAGCNTDTTTPSAASVGVAAPPPAASAATVSHPAATAPSPARTRRHTAPAHNGDTVLAAGVVLPNRVRTPGATNPAVTQSTIHATICVTGYTKTVRPSSSYTTGLKRQQLAAGYSYHGDLSTSDYEEDHLISLELGGSPSSVSNLWPEPYDAAQGARVKDRIENKLHDLVCSGRLSLRTAQHAIATNWWAAYKTYGGVATSSTSSTSTTSSTTATTSTSRGSGPSAQCRDGSYSYSQHRSGTCSHHGGVDHWINPPPS